MAKFDPELDEIYVLKEGRRLGPFTIENLLDGLESGDFSEGDVCLRPGARDLERVRDLLDWEEEAEAKAPDEDEDDDDGDDGDDDEEDEEGGNAPRRSAAVGSSNRLLYAGHPSVLSYPVSVIALVGGVTGGAWVYRFDPYLTLAGLALAVAGLVRLSMVRFTHDYHIRPRRIEVTTGFLARSSREVRIEDIRSIHVSCRGILGMLGIGTVDFLTSGDTPEVSFERVWAARKIKTLVRKLQDVFE